MKRLLALASVSLVVLGWGADQALAFGCKCTYKCCAAQYNAFSPFCCNTVMCKKLFHPFKKCCHVMDCGQPFCPPACPPDFCYPVGDSCAPAVPVPQQGDNSAPAGGQQSFQAPMPMGANVGMMGMPYPANYGMPYGMVQPTGYPNGYYPGQGYPQAPMMMPGYGGMMPNGMAPMSPMPPYWNASMPTGR
jgi:hypothetical protein